ncbi:50S ribosomal protein L10, partial [Vibrio fluvialis]|nr:50S ribosomal protein L10 [Vibrio fluvialis]
FKDFAKENKAFEIKAAAYEGALTDVEVLATLPTYDEAIARLMMCMKEASAAKLARTIAAIRDQKEAAAA